MKAKISNEIHENLNNYKHQTYIHLRYDDLDTMGHVNNKAYLSFLEEARIKYMEDVIGFRKETLAFQLVVVRVDIHYLSPVFLGDEVVVQSRISRLSEKSLDVESVIIAQSEGAGRRVCSKALVTLVSFDSATGKSMAHNAEMVERIKKYEHPTL